MTTEVSEHYRRHGDRLERLFRGEALPEPIRLSGISRTIAHEEHAIPAGEIPALAARIVEDLWAQRSQATRDGVFRPLVVEHWGYGTHFVDAVFGAEVSVQPDGNTWSKKLTTRVGDLKPPNIAGCAVTQRMAVVADELARAAQNNGGIFITLPVLSCPLNIAVNLYGERFLIALIEDPEAAKHDVAVITEAIIGLHKLFLARMPSEITRVTWAVGRFMPAGYGLIDACTTQLISPAAYRAVIAPHDNSILALYPHGGMIHLCGASEQHIPTWRDMPALRAVQINDRATDAFEAYFNGLRDDQILYVCPTEKVNIETILRVSHGGRRVVIVTDTP